MAWLTREQLAETERLLDAGVPPARAEAMARKRFPDPDDSNPGARPKRTKHKSALGAELAHEEHARRARKEDSQ